MLDVAKITDHLITCDIVLPSQFFATPRQQTLGKAGEYRLLVAVLENGVECFQKHVRAKSHRERRLFEEAEQWILHEEGGARRRDDDQPAFSFEYVCGVLGIDPDCLRRALQRWRDAQLATESRPR